MQTAVQLTADGDWQESVAYVQEAERLGVDMVWVAEAWGTDAVTPLAYLAAKTDRILLGSGVFQLGVRSAAMQAMTALTLQHVSDGRFMLGLGASGPQVMEGLHGVAFARPLARMRDSLRVLELAASGEKISLEGETMTLPLPSSSGSGEGKAIRLAHRAHETPIPVYIASLSPAMLRFTGEVAQGWLGTSFVPEGAEDAYFVHLREGAARSHRSLDDLDICQGAELAFGDDLDETVAERRAGLAFSLGGMGSATTNFYNSAYSRQGFDEVAERVQQLWLEGKRSEAAEAVPDELVTGTTLIGPEEHVRSRLQAWSDAGVDTVRLYPAGETLDERLATLAKGLELIADLETNPSR